MANKYIVPPPDQIVKLERSPARFLATTELMDILIHRLQNGGLDFCTSEQCLALLSHIEAKSYEGYEHPEDKPPFEDVPL